MRKRPAVTWFEVENFLRYFDHYAAPTGIQRVCFEIFSAADSLSNPETPVRFCRLRMFTGRFEQVPFEEIKRAYTSGRGGDAPWSVLPVPRGAWRAWRAAFRAARRFPIYAARTIRHAWGDVAKVRHPDDENELGDDDVIVSVGSSWVTRNYCRHIARLKRNHNIRLVQFVHDIIPILFPDWTPWFGRPFYRWVKNVAQVSDLVVTVSNKSHIDLETFARTDGFALPPVQVVRLGTGFPAGGRCSMAVLRPRPASAVVQSLPKRFVLCVSTLENRKNHKLLLTVWRNLLDAHGPANVPHLVLVGRVSYFVLDTWSLRLQLLDRRLRDRLVVTGNLNDGDLAEAYKSCLFTVFPSLYEGWGLPVEESLAHGKFCITSNSSSLPEVGGDWVDYFDPNDVRRAQQAIERALFQPGYVEAREARIRAHYQPSSWADCARQLIGHAEWLANAAVAR